jgi:phenylacetic acid degradation operon negative regulatory protein
MLTVVGPAPVLSRRHAAGAESARGLLLTVLGELVLTAGGAAWTSAFIDVLGRLGVEEKAARQALMRTAADGWLRSGRDGRRTRWSLTADGERLLTEGTARIYGFTAAMPDWDGRWLVVLARTPESDRPVRHLLRTRLTWAGLGSPAPGVWVSPHTDRATEVGAVLAAAGLRDAHVFLGPHAGPGAAADLVRQAWDLAAVDRAYAAFRADFAAATARDPLARLLELVHAWRRFPAVDPALPPELLPPGWNGAQAAALFHRRHAAWAPAATAAWATLNAL